MNHCDEIRLIRRDRDDSGQRTVTVAEVDLDDVARELERAWRRTPGTFTGNGIRPKLHVITPVVCEAFFASAVVLTEGESDIAALKATAALKGLDLEAMGCSLVSVGGKGNIDKVLSILRLLRIPVYAVWDLDRNQADKGRDVNEALLRMFGVDPGHQIDLQTRVEPAFACHADKLETTLGEELGDLYRTLLTEIADEYGVRRKDAEKSPLVIGELIRRAAAQGYVSTTLGQMLDAVLSMSRRREIGHNAPHVPELVPA